MGISTHRPWHPVDLDLDGTEEEPAWTRISYTDDRDSLPTEEPTARWMFESVSRGDPIR